MRLLKRITYSDLIIFSKELSILIKSGLPILSCLKILTEHTANSKLKEAIIDIKKKIEAGSSLSYALESSNIFSKFYTTSVKAGEIGDTVSDVLMYLYGHLNFVNNLRKKILSAFLYPSFLFIIATFAVFYLLIFVVPVFSRLYSEMGQNLPYLTRILIVISNTIKSNLIFIIVILIIVRIIYRYLLKIYKNRVIVDKIKLSLPFIGDIAKKYIFTYFFTTFSTLLKSGVHLPKALEVSLGNIENTFIYSKMSDIVDYVNSGSSLANALKNTEVVHDIAIEMVHTGEETGSLEEMLNSIVDIYEEEVTSSAGTLLVILEPLLMLIIGILIGSILLAMYLPIFEMSARF